MAFSFRAGTNWYHDFPKLAHTAGFYFNAHTTRVRVDWNRIGSIDIDRVIRERDFQTVDENVNNVIDYCLESEYDVKILDPNFVKLFRLAQLSVEYLLYCKQYLDFTVAVLKDEFKLKLEENKELEAKVKQLKDEIQNWQESYSRLQKRKPELHTCPHPECGKAFVSASYFNSHIARRHPSHVEQLQLLQSKSGADLCNSSPGHDQYKAETEKLRDEIKSLKERLNQTERVIRINESASSFKLNEIAKKDKLLISSIEAGDSTAAYEREHEREYKASTSYQEEINNLKTMLFTEIRNIKKKEAANKDHLSNQQDNDNNNESIKQLVDHQEDEIQRLKNELQDHLTSNANDFQTKLSKQEDYWKAKIEQLESQHRKDIDNLYNQLKMTQESSGHMKSEYEEKLSFLERQSKDQSKLLSSQSEQLNNLSKEASLLVTNRSQQQAKQIKARATDSQNTSQKKNQTFERESLTTEDTTMDSESSQNLNKSIRKILSQSDHRSPVHAKSLSSTAYTKLLSAKNSAAEESPLRTNTREELARESNLSMKYNQERKPKNRRQTTKAGNKYSSLDEWGKSETSGVSESETDTEEDSEEEKANGDGDETSESSGSRTESTDDEALSDDATAEELPKDRRSSVISLDAIKEEMEEAFEKKLRDLGIDPEWSGIPVATFRQKLETIRHQQNISCKKYPNYEQIRKKLFEELTKRIPSTQKFSPKKAVLQQQQQHRQMEKKSFSLNKAVKTVKSKALKALSEFKLQQKSSQDSSTPVISSKNSTPRAESAQPKQQRRFSLELLPKKPTHQDIQDIKAQARLSQSAARKSKQRDEPTATALRSSLRHHADDDSLVVESPQQRAKLLQRSYQSIEEFMRDMQDETKTVASVLPPSTKLDMTSTKVTSTPSRNVRNILQDSWRSFGGNDSDGQSAKQDTLWALASSPAAAAAGTTNSKSVLKSTSASLGSSATAAVSVTKKKVIFDLEKEDSLDDDDDQQKGEQIGEKELLQHDNGYITATSAQNEMKNVKTALKEKASESTENLHLKTSQSEKIAEISRRIQEKLAASRSQKPPAGSHEAMFAVVASSPLKSTSDSSTHNSALRGEKPAVAGTSHVSLEAKPRSIQVPRPAPRSRQQHTFHSKDSDLDTDIEDLLIN